MKLHVGTKPARDAGTPKTALTLVLAIAFLSLVMILSYVFITATAK